MIYKQHSTFRYCVCVCLNTHILLHSHIVCTFVNGILRASCVEKFRRWLNYGCLLENHGEVFNFWLSTLWSSTVWCCQRSHPVFQSFWKTFPLRLCLRLQRFLHWYYLHLWPSLHAAVTWGKRWFYLTLFGWRMSYLGVIYWVIIAATLDIMSGCAVLDYDSWDIRLLFCHLSLSNKWTFVCQVTYLFVPSLCL